MIRLWWILWLLPLAAWADGGGQPVGARAAALGGASLTLVDAWSVFNSVGTLGALESAAVGIYYQNQFGFPTVALGAAYPTPRYGTAGLSLWRFGDDAFSETRAGLAYGHQISQVRLGVRVNYWQVAVGELGARHALALDFGGSAEIIPTLTFGASISNLNQAKLADYNDERFPTVMRAGLAYEPLAALTLSAETAKDLDYPAGFRVGVAYRPIAPVALRVGLQTLPGVARNANVASAGFGLRGHAFTFDYALTHHPDLGLGHHVALAYRFNRAAPSGP